jgi:hypothetical protein
VITTQENETPRDPLGAARRLTRRTLLKVSGAAALALSTAGTALAAQRRRLSYLRRSSYLPLVGQRFAIAGGGELVLVAVRDLQGEKRGSDDAFALCFAGLPGTATLTSGLPRLHHPALGLFPLFVTTGKTTATSQHFCAVINRLNG